MVNVYTLYVHNSVPSAGGLAEQLQSTGSIKIQVVQMMNIKMMIIMKIFLGQTFHQPIQQGLRLGSPSAQWHRHIFPTYGNVIAVL